MILSPIEEIPDGASVGKPGIFVSDVGREELEEPAPGVLVGSPSKPAWFNYLRDGTGVRSLGMLGVVILGSSR